MLKTTKKKIRNAAIVTVSVVLTATALFSLGFLSFVGFFLLFPSVALAMMSLVLAGIVEFTVIFENIRNAFTKLAKKSYLKSRLAVNYLNKLVKKTAQKSWFLDLYNRQKHFVNAQHDRRITNKRKKGTAPGEQDYLDELDILKEEQKRLKKIQKSFRFYLFNSGPVSEELKAELDQLVPKSKREQLIKEEKRKRILGRLVILPVVFAAISCGVVTYSAIMGALAEILPLIQAATSAITLSAAAIAPIMMALSAVAAVAYALQMYNTAMNIIYDDSLQKLWHRIVKNVKKGGPTSILYGLGVLCLIGLGVFVTCATAGTWWGAIRPAIAILSGAQTAVTAMAVISIFFYGCANLAFNLQNTGETLKNLKSFSITKTIDAVRAKIKERFKSENIWQRINPFRVIISVTNTPFKILGFILHLVAIGATTDNFGNPIVACAASGITEGFEDGPYFEFFTTHGHGGRVKGGDSGKHDHKDHSHKGHAHHEKHKHENEHEHHHGHSHGDGHGHNHVDIFGAVFLLVMFIPLYLPAILWDWAFSQRNDDHTFKKLTFKDAWQKAFNKTPEHLDGKRPELNKRWEREQEYVMRNQSSKKYTSGALHAKTAAELMQLPSTNGVDLAQPVGSDYGQKRAITI